jgi:hypothetical protein
MKIDDGYKKMLPVFDSKKNVPLGAMVHTHPSP